MVHHVHGIGRIWIVRFSWSSTGNEWSYLNSTCTAWTTWNRSMAKLCSDRIEFLYKLWLQRFSDDHAVSIDLPAKCCLSWWLMHIACEPCSFSQSSLVEDPVTGDRPTKQNLSSLWLWRNTPNETILVQYPFWPTPETPGPRHFVQEQVWQIAHVPESKPWGKRHPRLWRNNDRRTRSTAWSYSILPSSPDSNAHSTVHIIVQSMSAIKQWPYWLLQVVPKRIPSKLDMCHWFKYLCF